MDHLHLNGKPYTLNEPKMSLETLLEREALIKKRIAVELNQKIIPRSQYDKVILKPGDRVEVVAAIGGG